MEQYKPIPFFMIFADHLNDTFSMTFALLLNNPCQNLLFLKIIFFFLAIFVRSPGRIKILDGCGLVAVSNLFPASVDLTGSWMEGQGHGAGGRSVDGTFGWGGAAGTLAAVDYNLGLRSGLFTQYMPTDVYSVRDEFFEAMAKDTASMRERMAA